jgi:hypothetical protein
MELYVKEFFAIPFLGQKSDDERGEPGKAQHSTIRQPVTRPLQVPGQLERSVTTWTPFLQVCDKF